MYVLLILSIVFVYPRAYGPKKIKMKKSLLYLHERSLLFAEVSPEYLVRYIQDQVVIFKYV